MISAALRLTLLAVLLATLGCGKNDQVPPFANVDRIAVGAYDMPEHAEISDPAEIAKLVSFANQRRTREWTCCGLTKHGRGGLLLHFYSQGEYQGYFGVHGPHFYTRVKRGEARLKPDSVQEVRDFINLIPPAARNLKSEAGIRS